MSENTYDEMNIFAKILRNEIPSYQLFNGIYGCSFLDAFPMSRGHTLLIPKKLGDQSYLDMSLVDYIQHISSLPMIGKAIFNNMNCDGMNICSNMGEAAGQVVFHPHLHFVPRYNHDNLLDLPRGSDIPYDINEVSSYGNQIKEKLINLINNNSIDINSIDFDLLTENENNINSVLKMEWDSNNLLNHLIQGDTSVDVFKIYENDDILIILDPFPSVPCEILIITKNTNVSTILDMSQIDVCKFSMYIPDLSRILKEVLECDGVNLLINNGEAAGQHIFHPHIHLIPRYNNDNLFHYAGSSGMIQSDEANEILNSIKSNL